MPVSRFIRCLIVLLGLITFSQLPEVVTTAYAQEVSDPPGYTEGEKRRISRARANRSDPNLSADKKLRHRGRRSGFLGLFHRRKKATPNNPANQNATTNYQPSRPNPDVMQGIEGHSPDPPNLGASPVISDQINRFQGRNRVLTPRQARRRQLRNQNYQGNTPAVNPDVKNRQNGSGLNATSNYQPSRPNPDVMEAIEGHAPDPPNLGASPVIMDEINRFQGRDRVLNPRQARRRQIRNQNYQGDTPAVNPDEKNRQNSGGLNATSSYYPGRPNKDVMEGIANYAPDDPNLGASPVIMDNINRYQGDDRVPNQRRLRRLRSRNLNYQGDLNAQDPATRNRQNNEGANYTYDYAPGRPNKDIMDGIANYAPDDPKLGASNVIMDKINRYQGDDRVPTLRRLRRQQSRNLNYQGELDAIDPEKRYRTNSSRMNYAYDFAPGRPNRDIMEAIADYAPTSPKLLANNNIMDAINRYRGDDRASSYQTNKRINQDINDYTAYHTIRTEKAQARYYKRITRRSSEYLGEYPTRIRVREQLLNDSNPTQNHLIGRNLGTKEREEKLRRFNIWWNRIFKRNIQPDVYKKRQRSPRYDRGEAEWWEQLDQRNTVDPTEGAESDSGD